MADTRLDLLQQDWQRAVREHEALIRDARQRGATLREAHKISNGHLLRVDAAYSRFKLAESKELATN
jgi:hypothetical protein